MDENEIGTAVMDCDKPFVSCDSACSLFTMQWDSGLATEALALASPETHLEKILNHGKHGKKSKRPGD